jgi:hypothetical protein
MSQRSLKELVALVSISGGFNTSSSLQLEFAPKMRLQELQAHYENIFNFGSNEVKALQPLLGK